MQDAEFEEKEYEAPLVHQLLGASTLLWAPGQVFEQYFGVDATLFICNPNLWRLFNRRTAPAGVILDNLLWAPFWIHRRPRRHRPLPSFTVNLLLQVKRSQYLNGIHAGLKAHGIKGSYWRFKTTPHQQTILERLATKLHSRAVVSYASPAFHTLADLYNHIESGGIVQNSTFVRAARLHGHCKWVYDQAGCRGVACSEMESVDDVPFFSQLERVAERVSPDAKPDIEYAAHELRTLSGLAVETCKEEQSEKNPIPEEFFRRQEMMEQNLPKDFPNREHVADFARFAMLMHLLAIDWFVIGAQEKPENPNKQ